MTITKEKTGGKVGNTKVSVIMNLDENSVPDYIAYDNETDLLLLSRDNSKGALKALDLEKGIIGTVNCSFQVSESM